jgi:hypothetical protein
VKPSGALHPSPETRVSLDTGMELANQWFAVVVDGRVAATEVWSP